MKEQFEDINVSATAKINVYIYQSISIFSPLCPELILLILCSICLIFVLGCLYFYILSKKCRCKGNDCKLLHRGMDMQLQDNRKKCVKRMHANRLSDFAPY
jgi:hypothetical protein